MTTIYDSHFHISGQPVIDLQNDINSYYGYHKVDVDGFCGPLTLEACPEIHKGNVYKIVGEAQKRLQAKGFYLGASGTIDNSFGPYMDSEVKRYQVYWSMAPNGVIDKIFWHKIYEILS